MTAERLLAVEMEQRERFSEFGERIMTGCEEIDEVVLGGGLERGVVVGLSADASEGQQGTLVSLSSWFCFGFWWNFFLFSVFFFFF